MCYDPQKISTDLNLNVMAKDKLSILLLYVNKVFDYINHTLYERNSKYKNLFKI